MLFGWGAALGDLVTMSAFWTRRYPERVNDPAEAAAQPPGAARTEGHLIQQAEVPPLDVDGVQAATVGTVVFGVASAVFALGYDRLVGAGDGWWLGVALSGLGLGLVSLGYTISRRRRRRARRSASGAAPTTG